MNLASEQVKQIIEPMLGEQYPLIVLGATVLFSVLIAGISLKTGELLPQRVATSELVDRFSKIWLDIEPKLREEVLQDISWVDAALSSLDSNRVATEFQLHYTNLIPDEDVRIIKAYDMRLGNQVEKYWADKRRLHEAYSKSADKNRNSKSTSIGRTIMQWQLRRILRSYKASLELLLESLSGYNTSLKG